MLIRVGRGRIYSNAAFTCDLSTIDGTAFITNPSVDISFLINRKFTLTTGGKTLVGWGKAAGSAETLDTAMNVSDCVQSGHDTFSGVSSTGFHAENAAGSAYCGTADEIGTTEGDLVKASFTSIKVSGTNPFIYYGVTLTGDNTPYSLLPGVSALTGSYYQTMPTNTGVFLFYNIGAVSYTISNLAVCKVLTPSATGITIVSTQRGTTYDWTSNDGINSNATSFVLTVTAT